MRYFYFAFFLFFSLNSYSQNDLIGEWFLHSVTTNGIQEINTYQPTFSINFTTNPGLFSDFEYDGNTICNGYFGEYSLIGNNEISFFYFVTTLGMCTDTDEANFENKYFSLFYESAGSPIMMDYSLNGSGNNQTLILTDANNNSATYGIQALSVPKNNANDLSISLYKNPVKHELTLIVKENLGKLSYQIFSVEGKLVQQSQILENKTINLNDWNSGMYFLVISTQNNFRQTLKFFKQ